MKSFHLWPLTRLANGSSMSHLLSLTVFCLLSLIFCTSLKADYQTSNIPYGITVSSGTFNEDDTVSVSIWAGNASENLNYVQGFDLTFTLTEHAVFPSQISLNFSKSWMNNGQEVSYTVNLDSGNLTITFDAFDSTLSENGYGEIASFELISASNNVTGSQLLEGSGGGVIIQIDDLGLRRANPVRDYANSYQTIYPNPTSGKVFWKGDVSTVSHWILRDLYGKELARGTQIPMDLRAYNQPAGRYYLEIHLKEGLKSNYPILFH